MAFLSPTTRPGLVLVVLVAVHALVVTFPQPGVPGQWLSDLMSIPAFLVAGAACWPAARRTGSRAWPWFGVGLIAFGLGNVVWTYLELVRHVQPFPSVADALYLGMPVAFLIGFLRLPRPTYSRACTLRLLLDLALVLGAVALFFWRFLLGATLDAYAAQPVALIVALAYPALDLALLALAALLAVQGGGLARRPTVLVALGLLNVVVADTAFAYYNAQGTYGSGVFTDVFWTLGAALIGLGAQVDTPGPATLPAAPRVRWWTAAPYVAVTGVTLLQLTALGERDSSALGVLLGGSVLTLLVVVRQTLSLRENAALTAALRDASLDLERRVDERTEALRHQGHALDRANAELRALSAALEQKVEERTAALEASRAQLTHQAQHDALTGLPNRGLFEDRLAQATRHAERYGGVVAVLFIDLDGFKYVNDTFGHVAGDEVLQETGRRLTDCVRAADTVARLGGDEFVVLLTSIAHAADVRTVAQRILNRLTLPVPAAGQEVRITASIGVSVVPDDGATAQALMVNADVAMYEAKQQGKNAVRFYTPGMNVAAQRRSVVERRLRGALDRGDFTLHYQPQHDGDGRVSGFEALLRWTDPELGPVSPAEFIPVAEDAGLIVPVGAWVLDEACRQNALWQRDGLPPVCMAVNVSPTQFAREDFVPSVVQTLARHGLDAHWLELELTEQLVVQDIQATADKMTQLRALGVRVAIDDFGAGHSALSYLMRLPVSTLKIDRAFIHDLGRVDGAARVVGAISALAHALGLEVVAEGVETEAQLREVRELGCEFTQGYLLGRPGPPEHARAALETLIGGPGGDAAHRTSGNDARPVVSPSSP